jgi:hypothetical protein
VIRHNDFTYLDVAGVEEEAALGEAAVRRRFVGAMEWNGIRIAYSQIKIEYVRLSQSKGNEPISDLVK